MFCCLVYEEFWVSKISWFHTVNESVQSLMDQNIYSLYLLLIQLCIQSKALTYAKKNDKRCDKVGFCN